MATTNALQLNKLLSESIGDFIQESTTVILTNTNTHVISSAFQQVDGGRDDSFTDWHAYCVNGNNAGKERKIRNYYTANYTANVFGAVWTNDTAVANVRLGRYSYSVKRQALNDALRETYPSLYRRIDDKTSIVTNSDLYEYAMPSALDATGSLMQVLINTAGTTGVEDNWARVYGFDVVNEGHTLRLPFLYTSGYKVRLLGIAPLETVSADTDTVNVDGERLNLILAYAKYKLYQQVEGIPASVDISRYERQSAKAYSEYLRLKPQLSMMPPVASMNLRTY